MKSLNSKVKEKILQTTIKKNVTCKGEKKQTGTGLVSGMTESESQREGIWREKNKKISHFIATHNPIDKKNEEVFSYSKKIQ